MKKIILFIIFLLLTPFLIYAHQPRQVKSENIEVKNPEVSQAFYARLSGNENYYHIYSEKPFELYVGLLIPENLKIKTEHLITVSAEILKDNQKIFYLDGKNYNWERYYEEFAGDYYYKGPEIKKQVEGGSYTVKVFNDNNQGSYVFVVGQKEEFPPNETLNTIIVLPQIKKDYFGKSPFTAFSNKIGLFIFGPIIIVLVLIFCIVIFIKKRMEKLTKTGPNIDT